MLNVVEYCLKYLYLKRRKKKFSFSREKVKRKSRTVLEKSKGKDVLEGYSLELGNPVER